MKKSKAKQEFDDILKVDETEILTELEKSNALSLDKNMQFANETGSLANTKKKMAERRKHIIDLHVMGISAKSIMEQVNKLALTRGWAESPSEQSVRQIISGHFKNYSNPESGEFEDHNEGLKQAMFAQQEHLLEKATVLVADKDKKWVPFEQMSAIKELYLMRDKMIENRNWNDSKYNPNMTQHNTTNQLNVFIDNSVKIGLGTVADGNLEKLRGILKTKFK